jgi:hypothetical protein
LQAHVEDRELELAHEVGAGLESSLAASSLSKSSRGMRSPLLHVVRHRRHHVPLPAEVLHELARQLDRVPLDAVEARDAELVDLR